MSDMSVVVETRDLVEALKRLKLHQKSRRKTELLIQPGLEPGQLVLELRGGSKLDGILTPLKGSGEWNSSVPTPAGFSSLTVATMAAGA